MKNLKKLSRSDLKMIIGGKQYEPSPVGGGIYKCCWSGTFNCSGCTAMEQPTCVSGAYAMTC